MCEPYPADPSPNLGKEAEDRDSREQSLLLKQGQQQELGERNVPQNEGSPVYLNVFFLMYLLCTSLLRTPVSQQHLEAIIPKPSIQPVAKHKSTGEKQDCEDEKAPY